MITKFRIFENNEDKPKVGDYVLCDISKYSNDKELINFIKDNVGEIISYDKVTFYLVKYYNIPKELDDWYFGIGGVRHFTEEDILLYASTKEELETKIKANKFNL
jgi:hypothetical protein